MLDKRERVTNVKMALCEDFVNICDAIGTMGNTIPITFVAQYWTICYILSASLRVVM